MAYLLPLVHLLVGELVGDLLVLERAGLLDVALLAAEAALRGERHRAVSDARWAVRCCAVLSGARCAVRRCAEGGTFFIGQLTLVCPHILHT